QFAPQTIDIGRTFTLTAIGQSSGFTAQTAFTDAVTVTVSCSPNPVAVNSPTTCTANGSGNNTANATITWSTSGSGSFTPSTCSLPKNGSCSVGYTPTAVGSGTQTITATDATDSASGTFTLNIFGSATKLAFTTSPSNSTAGAAFSAVVTLQDATGNTVTGTAQNVTVAIQNNPGSGTLSGTTTVAVNTSTGQATFSGLSIDKAGTGYTLTATGSTVSTTPGVVLSNAFNITAGAVNTVAFVQQPTDTVAGVAISFPPGVTVQLQNQFNNNVSTAGVSIGMALTTGTGTLGGTTTQTTDANGLATFSDLNINLSGSNKVLTASSTGLTSAASSTFTINA